MLHKDSPEFDAINAAARAIFGCTGSEAPEGADMRCGALGQRSVIAWNQACAAYAVLVRGQSPEDALSMGGPAGCVDHRMPLPVRLGEITEEEARLAADWTDDPIGREIFIRRLRTMGAGVGAT